MNKRSNSKAPVALFFFNRPDLLEKTFQAVKRYEPDTLFLIQDGARPGNREDASKVERCREIVENIDWECKVYREYSGINLGCGERIYTGISFAFEYIDRLVVLEDDCIPSSTFFDYCAYLLDKYKDDDRIDMVCGMNNLGKHDDINSDYFFSDFSPIWGWATWRRSWEGIDFELNMLNDDYISKNIYLEYGNKGKELLGRAKKIKRVLDSGGKVSSWSTQKKLHMLANSRLAILPKYNMVKNAGIGVDGTNSPSAIKYVPRGLRSIYSLESYDITFPLAEPSCVIRDVAYTKRLDRLMGFGHPVVSLYRKLEISFYMILNGEFGSLIRKISSYIR